MSLEERDTNSATIAGYGLLASMALTVLRRIVLVEQGRKVRAVSEDDARHLKLLLELLGGSVRGAVLAGRQNAPQDLMGGNANLSLDAKLQMYHVVDEMVGHDRYDDFITNAQVSLAKLMSDRSRGKLSTEEKKFVDTELTEFLERLKRGGDYVVAEHEPFGLHRALA
jgi:hypothetical protein